MNIVSWLMGCALFGLCSMAFAGDRVGPEFVVDVGYVAEAGHGCPKYARVMGPDKYCWPAVLVRWMDGRIADIQVSLNEVCFYEKTAQMSITPTVFVCGTRNRVCRRCT